MTTMIRSPYNRLRRFRQWLGRYDRLRRFRQWLDRIERRLEQQFFYLRGHLPYKQSCELWFWDQEIKVLTRWYEGKIAHHYGVPAPTDKMKIKDYDLTENAVRTWTNADFDKYADRLLIPRDYFDGKRILDVGCGPIPYALVFTNCEIYGLDQLIDGYRELGYPLDKYSDRLTYIKGNAEDMPFEDNFFDAVISVNAIDHVDDFPVAAKEIARVLRPEGVLRIEVHYHKSTTEEPWSLNDDLIIKLFGDLGIKKVHERSFIELISVELYPEEVKRHKREKLVVWSNKD